MKDFLNGDLRPVSNEEMESILNEESGISTNSYGCGNGSGSDSGCGSGSGSGCGCGSGSGSGSGSGCGCGCGCGNDDEPYTQTGRKNVDFVKVAASSFGCYSAELSGWATVGYSIKYKDKKMLEVISSKILWVVGSVLCQGKSTKVGEITYSVPTGSIRLSMDTPSDGSVTISGSTKLGTISPVEENKPSTAYIDVSASISLMAYPNGVEPTLSGSLSGFLSIR